MACAALLGLAPTAPATAQDYPDRSITWLIGFGAGGGTDLWARLAGNLLNKQGLTDATFLYENRTGGSGVRAFSDLINRNEGDPNILFPFQDLVIVPWLQGQIPHNYKDLTIIAGLALDRHLLLVNADSEFNTVEDLVEAAKKEPLVVGIGSSGRFPAAMFADAADLELRQVRFEGDAEIVMALLGNHVQAAFANPSEVLGHLEAGTLKALAVAGPKRLGSMPDVPTFIESGYNVDFGLFRGLGMAPGVSDEVKKYWEERIAKLVQSDEWQNDYIKKYSLDSTYMTGDELVAFIENDLLPVYKRVLEMEAK
jgi:putative tricarboxylic transport membrane protein